MKILNDENFANLCSRLITSGIENERVINNEPSLNEMDFHWFLLSLLEALEENAPVKIMDDRSGDEISYKLIEAELDDTKLNLLTLTLEENDSKDVVVNKYLIKKVDDSRMLGNNRKYYITTDESMYRIIVKRD